MNELAKIMWETMSDKYKMIVENICNEYESNPKYTVKKIHEGLNITGFYCYYDTPEFRFIEFGAYTGKNKFMALKMWKELTKGLKVIRLLSQNCNGKMVEFYKRQGFKVIQSDLNNLLMERRR
jgi:hypothetical protein